MNAHPSNTTDSLVQLQRFLASERRAEDEYARAFYAWRELPQAEHAAVQRLAHTLAMHRLESVITDFADRETLDAINERILSEMTPGVAIEDADPHFAALQLADTETQNLKRLREALASDTLPESLRLQLREEVVPTLECCVADAAKLAASFAPTATDAAVATRANSLETAAGY